MGIYSFASLVAEGCYQLVVVVQNNLNPILSRVRSVAAVRTLFGKVSKLLVPVMVLGVGFGYLVYEPVALLLTGNEDVAGGGLYFLIIGLAVAVCSSMHGFVMVLNQWGYPLWFTLQLSLTIVTNIVLNAALIPVFGVVGAAIATASTLLLTAGYIHALTYLATKKALFWSSSAALQGR